MKKKEPKIALVLSGGGARGAYEVGVLKYIFTELREKSGVWPNFNIIAGTSVGAVNGCAIASFGKDTKEGIKQLERIWLDFDFHKVFRFPVKRLLELPSLFLSKKAIKRRKIGGILDTTPLERLVIKKIPWQRLRKNIRNGYPEILIVTATDIITGCTEVFIDHGTENLKLLKDNPYLIPEITKIGPLHALASAAIPIVFPLVRIGDRYYADGGIRLNTPISPALRLGADKIFIIGLKHKSESIRAKTKNLKQLDLANPLFLFGKLINSFVLDHTEYDLDRLRMLNALLSCGIRTYGYDFIQCINQEVEPRRGMGYKIVKDCYIAPSENIGKIAAHYTNRLKKRFSLKDLSGSVLGLLVSFLNPEDESDLMSYLLFDSEYVGELISLGYSDAKRNFNKICEFFKTD